VTYVRNLFLLPTAPLCHFAPKEAASYYFIFYSLLFLIMSFFGGKFSKKGQEAP
jgi:hypothetical protein